MSKPVKRERGGACFWKGHNLSWNQHFKILASVFIRMRNFHKELKAKNVPNTQQTLVCILVLAVCCRVVFTVPTRRCHRSIFIFLVPYMSRGFLNESYCITLCFFSVISCLKVCFQMFWEAGKGRGGDPAGVCLLVKVGPEDALVCLDSNTDGAPVCDSVPLCVSTVKKAKLDGPQGMDLPSWK